MFIVRSLLVAFWFVCAPAFAQELSLTVSGDTPCPSRAQVADALARLVPAAKLVADHAVLSASVTDLGESYVVRAATERTIEDSLRRCPERANAAALVIALALDELPPPPLVLAPEPPPPVVLLTPTAPRRELLALALIDRPLVLRYLRTEARGEVSYASLRGTSPAGAGFTTVVSGDVGLGRRVQVGLAVAAPVALSSSAVAIIPRLMIGLHRDVALRIELGFNRSGTYDHDGNFGDLDGGFVALALVTRVRLHPMLSILFGDTGAREELPVHANKLTNELMTVTSHALLAVNLNAANLDVAINLPIALLFQPHRRVAIRLGAGVRFAFDQTGFLQNRSGFPLSFDLTVSPTSHLDVGASFGVPLQISSPGGLLAGALFARARF